MSFYEPKLLLYKVEMKVHEIDAKTQLSNGFNAIRNVINILDP